MIMNNCYDDELSLLLRPSVADLRRRYEEMVAKLNSGGFVWPKRPKRRSVKLDGPIIFPTQFIPENAALQVNMHIFEEPQRDDHAISEVEVQTLQFYKVPSDSYEKVIDNYPNEVITPPASQDSTRAAVVTINNLDDFLAIFEYSDDVDNTIYKIDLSNNSIGNEALEEFTTSVRNLNTRITLAVVSLDLSWNDLEEESIIPFSQVVLEKFSGLTSIKLDGNPIGVQGLEAILCAVGKTPIASTIDISVRETSIGDDGASCLGGFLKDNQLPITSLDLTNSCIFEGAVALALDLHDNTTLHTLIMDDNMIGNPGAFALGEALMANTHLRKLQIRNCDISATGIAGLCDGIRIHPVLEFLDVSLNPWELVGELKLLELMWALPRAVAIKWREGGWDYGEEELDFVVNHFSAESVLKRISETDSDAFCPLITNTQLLHCDLLASAGPGWIASQLAQKKHDSQYLEFALRALEVLTELATIHTGNQEPWTSILGTFCPLFSVWLSSTRLSFPTGLLQIKLVPLFCALVQFGDSVINGTLLQCIHKCMDLFFEFPKRNMFHQHITELVEIILATKETNESRGKLHEYVCGDFAPKLMKLVEENAHKQTGNRSCLYGHAILLVPKIGAHINPKLWVPFERDHLKAQQQIMNTPLCGGPPPKDVKSRRLPVMDL